ncbi:ExeA family protein [Desulfonatronum parangueonense]
MLFQRDKTAESRELLQILRSPVKDRETSSPTTCEAYFGLNEPPFSLTPDTSFFFEKGTHQEALNVLLVALAAGDGFLKVIGEVGTGKTLLCRKLLSLLDETHVTAYLHYPMLTPDGLRLALAEELGLDVDSETDQHRLLKLIHHHLLEITAQGRRVVVCLDEAQCMPDETLEALRLLSNLETEKEKLLSVVMFGQPELDVRLAGKTLRQLRTRIAFSHFLAPMDSAAVQEYVVHRLHVAGDDRAGERFTLAALRRIASSSRGVPRIVNILARKALMAAWGLGMDQVAVVHARRAVLDSEEAERPAFLSLDGLRFALERWG